MTRDTEYGRLSNRSIDAQQGEGGEAASRKKSSGDFALWKSAKAEEPSWQSPWGLGATRVAHRMFRDESTNPREKRSISMEEDWIWFSSHENELAQSRCCHDAPMVKYWLHNGLMRASSATGKSGGKNDRTEENTSNWLHLRTKTFPEKFPESKGAGGLAQLIEKHTGERIRFFLLKSHYRSTTLFGDEPLNEAGVALEAFYRLFQRFERITGKSVYELDINRKRATFTLLIRSPLRCRNCYSCGKASLQKWMTTLTREVRLAICSI